MSGVEQLAEALKRTEGLFLVVTGAGISLASGIPTFRGTDKDAVWKKDVTELGTYHFFRENPAGSWEWYLKRFEALKGARPNAGHRALVELEAWRAKQGRPFLLVTQNIDTLHEQAGSKQLVEVHGSAAYVRCGSVGCELGAPKGKIPRARVDLTRFLAAPTEANVPRCPKCGDYLRQHVLWFDEYYGEHESYQWNRVLQAAATFEAVLFVGTSFAVGVTDLLLGSALQRERPAFSIDPSGRAPRGVVGIEQPSEVALVELINRLEAA